MLMADTVDEDLACTRTIASLADVGAILADVGAIAEQPPAGAHGIYAQSTWKVIYEAAEPLFEECQIMRSKVGWIWVGGTDRDSD